VNELLEEIAGAVAALQAALTYSDEHPENPYGGDDINYRKDHLDSAVNRYTHWEDS
jgi:hypothetical protein